VIDQAQVPSRSTGPRLAQNVIFGVALGAVIGIAIICLLEYLDTTVKDAADVQRLIGASPLGAIGVIPEPDDGDPLHNKLITAVSPRDSIAEAFRTVRTNLSFLSTDRELHHLVVTSSLAQEGKTLIASNLAVSLAQAGRRVILVDADLRVPRIHSQFGVPNLKGLSLLLQLTDEQEMARELVATAQTTGIDGLLVVPSGPIPPNPAELLGSVRLDAMMRLLRSSADVVIYDTPPMMPVTDSLLIASKADWTLLVARAQRVRREMLVSNVRTLREAGVNLAGVLLNMVQRSRMASYYQYYYYYGYGTPRPGSNGHKNGKGSGSNGHGPQPGAVTEDVTPSFGESPQLN
jgi:capsular exopolysaccharide synthesis family protein